MRAVVAYLKLLNIEVWPETDTEPYTLTVYWLRPPGNRHYKHNLGSWHRLTPEERNQQQSYYEAEIFEPTDIPRNDPNLVTVVEQLGSDASGENANLKVVEIPDDVMWAIEDYDGAEYVSEQHRTWS